MSDCGAQFALSCAGYDCEPVELDCALPADHEGPHEFRDDAGAFNNAHWQTHRPYRVLWEDAVPCDRPHGLHEPHPFEPGS